MFARAESARAFVVQLGLVSGLAFALGGCAAGEMTNMWADKSYNQGPVRSVFVVAIRNDAARRRIWEDAFVQELGARGVTATPSYRQFPELPDTDQVVQAVHDNGYDAMIVSDRLENQTNTVYVPGYVTTQPVTRYDRWRGAYTTDWMRVRTPGYTETMEVRRFETKLYSMRDDGILLWAGTMETPDALDGDAIRRAVGRQIVPEIAKAGFLPAGH